MPDDDKTPVWRTSDFAVACYVFSQGVKIRKYERIPGTRNQFTFYFDDPDRLCSGLEIAFVNSEAYQFDSAQRALKKLCLGR